MCVFLADAGTAYLQIPVSVAQQLAAAQQQAQQSPAGAQQAQQSVQAVLRNAGIQITTQPVTQAQSPTSAILVSGRYQVVFALSALSPPFVACPFLHYLLYCWWMKNK